MPDHHDDLMSGGPDELDELRALAGRVQMERTTWEQPPAGLWEQIADQAGVAAAPARTGPLAGAGAAPAVAPSPVPPPGATPPAVAPGSTPAPIDLDAQRAARRPRRAWLFAGAAAAAVVLVAGVVVAVDRPSEPTLVASAPLAALGPAGTGQADLVEDGESLSLRVDTADLDPGDGFLEVWVIDPDVTKLVSLGPLRPDGTYDLPAGLDPELFPVVDVSVEPLDGDPTHSGDSVLRGQLEF